MMMTMVMTVTTGNEMQKIIQDYTYIRKSTIEKIKRKEHEKLREQNEEKTCFERKKSDETFLGCSPLGESRGAWSVKPTNSRNTGKSMYLSLACEVPNCVHKITKRVVKRFWAAPSCIVGEQPGKQYMLTKYCRFHISRSGLCTQKDLKSGKTLLGRSLQVD